ncbi:MAG: Hsp20/alpha crystallin family protein [bacterium]|nr:Hsp20/alpha crystallin family protein [bacterium]
MMRKEKRSFFERITGSIRRASSTEEEPDTQEKSWGDDSAEGAQLAVDVYQTPSEIIVMAMIAGVKPDDLDVNITREMVVIKAKREEPESPEKERYVHKELYWGPFDRTIVLPDEVDADHSEAIEKHGLLIIRMPKFNKNHSKTLKIKSLG